MTEFKNHTIFFKNKKNFFSIKELNNKIIHGQTFKVLKKFPSKSVSLIITSPSYFLGKEYEKKYDFQSYLDEHFKIILECKRILKDNGAIFWNVAQTIKDQEIIPLGVCFYNYFKKIDFFLKNWIIWKFEGGQTPRSRLFGRYENILWFVKNKNNYIFNIDDIRIPSKWINDKRVHKKGKNPEDFWFFDERKNIEKLDLLRSKLLEYKKLISEKTEQYVNQILMDEKFRDIENEINDLIDTKNKVIERNLYDNIWHINRVVNISKSQKIKHPKTKETHPCPFPEKMIERIIKMSSNKKDLVLDIFSGSGTVLKVANDLNRNWCGIDKEKKYCEIAAYRLKLNRNI